MKSLDTHTAVKSLIAAGLPENQAEVIVATITIEKTQSDLATKGDLKLAISEVRREIADVKAELKADIAEVRAEIAEVKAELKADIAEVKTEIAEIKRDMRWGMGLLVGILTLSLSTLGVLAKMAFLV